MRIFISWSGPQAQEFADFLLSWLRMVIQELRPFMSARSIEKGTRWSKEIAQQLEDTNYAIVCVTQENQGAPWVHFEAGALAKATGSHVSPLLLNLGRSDVSGPLAEFQLTLAKDKTDVRQLVSDINSLLKDPLPESMLDSIFEREWPSFRDKLAEVVAMKPSQESPGRDPDDIMDELLNRVRMIERSGQDQFYLTRRLLEQIAGEQTVTEAMMKRPSRVQARAVLRLRRKVKHAQSLVGQEVDISTRRDAYAGELKKVLFDDEVGPSLIVEVGGGLLTLPFEEVVGLQPRGNEEDDYEIDSSAPVSMSSANDDLT